MKRFLYFLLLGGGIGASAYLVLFSSFSIVGAVGDTALTASATLWEQLVDVFDLVKAGSWDWSQFSAYVIFVYGLVLFLFISAVLLLSLLVMAVTTFFRFSRVYRFYATVWWFLLAALIFSGVLGYLMIESGADIIEFLKGLPLELFLPIGAAVVLCIIGAVFKKTERI